MRGGSTRVDTTVAIEFAASWKPLMKSNASASAISSTRLELIVDASVGAAATVAQAFSRTMPSMMFATSSQRSVTVSSIS